MQNENKSFYGEADIQEKLQELWQTYAWQPTNDEIWEAMRESLSYHSQGKLNDAELSWALSFLASHLIGVQLENALSLLANSPVKGAGFSRDESRSKATSR